MTPTRARAKGRIGGEGERFARMTDSLMQHPSVTTLDHAAFRVLTILTIGARSPGLGRHDRGYNGCQAVTDSHAKKYGLRSRDTVYRSLRKLTERGLIVKTREGHRNKSHFTLYAVGWLPITHRNGMPLNQPERAPNEWVKWQPPPEVKKTPSCSRTRSPPKGGRVPSSSHPMPASAQTTSHPINGSTSRLLGPQEPGADTAPITAVAAGAGLYE